MTASISSRPVLRRQGPPPGDPVIPRRRRQAGKRLAGWWLLPYAIALYLSAIAVVFSGQSRFHFPVMPLVAMSCAMLLVSHNRRRPFRSAPLSAKARRVPAEEIADRE